MTAPETLAAGPEQPRSGRRARGPIIALVVVIVLAVALAGYAFVRSRSGAAAPTTSPTPGTTAVGPSASPSTILTLPARFGTYQRDDRSTVDSPVEAGSDIATASAYYDLNGVRQVLLVGADPVYDLELFLLSIGLSEISAVGDGFCGDYSGVQMCAVLTDRLAVGVVGLTGQGHGDLVGIAQDARGAF